MNCLEQVKFLFDASLYEDVCSVGSFVMTLGEHNPDLLTSQVRYQILYYQAEALFHLREFKKSENVFKKSLQMKKMITKTKSKSSNGQNLTTEADIRYRIYQCLYSQKQYKEAISELEAISPKQRTSKVQLALAQLYQRIGIDRCAVTAYKEVLRGCPMSLEAARGLLQLGVKGVEVETMMRSSLTSTTNISWLMSWLKAQSFCATRDYTSAIQYLKMLDNKPLLRDNTYVLCSLGEAQQLNGDSTQAIETLQRVQHLDPLGHLKMDILSYLLYKEKAIKDLESLSTKLMAVSENSAESWITMGYFCMATRKAARAVYFGQKALNIDNHNVEGLLLKGAALLELKKMQEAIMHFREAIRLSPYRFEAYKGLVDCFLASHRFREAIPCASQACKQLPTARTLTLYATVLCKEPFNIPKAKGYLEKAMKMDCNYLEAVYVLADIYKAQGSDQHEKGIELLGQHLAKHPTSRLHQLMGDFLVHKMDCLGALDHFSKALVLDPNNTQAREALERVQKHEDVNIENSYDVEVDDIEGSDTEGDAFLSRVQDRAILPYHFEPPVSGSEDSDPYSD
ncbi:hypothetical protein LSH36_2g01059 [Paralvinella palmiformis]|uniref:Anaphase-promoting complex subunit 7 n=1 Tax=Paralvinella palmiformis TaxID=53620 RepID=A0AAD9KHA0_9ANNE|nr:hypothetical protein LSH36_2g01059 [Paralvinella palmiformis]